MFKPKRIVLFNFGKGQKARCDPVHLQLQLEYRRYLNTCCRIVGDSLG
jgi:hypothetical protein